MNPILRTCAKLGVLLAAPISAMSLTLDEVRAQTLEPYTGSTARGVDVGTLTGKIMCGYQGWFNVEGDRAERGWVHWVKGRGPMANSNVKVDLWPDLTEHGTDERFDTGLKRADGRRRRFSARSQSPRCCAISNGCATMASTVPSCSGSQMACKTRVCCGTRMWCSPTAAKGRTAMVAPMPSCMT